MAKLVGFTPQAGMTFYLDTNAVQPLVLKQAGLPMKPHDAPRPGLVSAFAAQGTRAGSRFVVSMLVIEEIAANARNGHRRDILKKNGLNDWHAYERTDRAQATIDQAAVQSTVVKLLQHTVDALSANGIVVEQAIVQNPKDDAKKLRLAHRAFMRKYPSLDAMDALHLALGAELGCKHFITFDKGWLPVTEATILGES